MRIAQALVWEYFARGWVYLLTAAAGAMAFASLVYAPQLGVLGANETATRGAGAELHFAMLWVLAFVFAVATIPAAGRASLRYALPATSRQIVACVMGSVATAAMLMSIVVGAAVNSVFGVGWPIVGPALLTAAIVAWFFAIVWLTEGSQIKTTFACGVSVLVLLVAIANVSGRVTAFGFSATIGWQQVVVFVVALAVSYAVGTAGFTFRRRGGQVDLLHAIGYLGNWTRGQVRSLPFRSAQTAEFWLEWNRRGYVLPLIAAVLGGAGFAGAMWASEFNAPVVASLCFSSLIPVVFIMTLLADRHHFRTDMA